MERKILRDERGGGIRDGKIRNTEKARRRKNSELNGIRQRERERFIQVADWKGLKDRGGKLAEKNRRAKKRLASNKAGERVGREMDGRLKGSEKV